LKSSKKIVRSFYIFWIIFLSFCAPRKEIDIIAPRQAKYGEKTNKIDFLIRKADSLTKRGNYSSMKEAFQIYQDFISLPAFWKEYKEKILKTVMLLALREKELGIFNGEYFKKASDLINNNSYPSDFPHYLKLIEFIRTKTKGVIIDVVKDFSNIKKAINWIKENELLIEKLKIKAEGDEFFAYLYISVNSALFNIIKEKDDFSRFMEIFPNSQLIKFKLATDAKENKESLNELIINNPRFYEAYYFLGEIALKEGQIVTAEKNYLKAYAQIPDSSSIIISLANVYFAFEEYDESLQYYEKAIELVPEYRDALLGKATCLSYLDKNKEAIKVLNNLLQLGHYFIGETHYWLAWNQNQLDKLDEAYKNAEKAENYLNGSSSVFSLSGIITYNQKNLEESERNFLKALKLEPFCCEASFYLGNIYAKKQNQENSGRYFERAGFCYERIEKVISGKIKEIENLSILEERKRKLILRKKRQLSRTSLKKATAFFNAAAGYFNAGMKEKALALAQKSASHSYFEEKAKELIKRIKFKEEL